MNMESNTESEPPAALEPQAERWPRAMPMDLRGRLESVAEDSVATAVPIAPDAPVFSGHYPGYPLLPGVFLIEAAIQAIEQQAAHFGRAVRVLALESVRFHAPVRPGDLLTCQGTVRERRSAAELVWDVACKVGEAKVAKVRMAVEVSP